MTTTTPTKQTPPNIRPSLSAATTTVPSKQIWYKDPRSFLSDDALADFWPRQERSLSQQLNAGMRFITYYTFLVFVLRRNVNILFVWIVAALLSYVVFESSQKEVRRTQDIMERLDLSREKDGSVCVRPTRDNPFMNVSLNEYSEFPNRPRACKITNQKTKEKAEQEFRHNLYTDVDDVFQRKASSRQFYTNPVTTIPNDQGGFANWCYKKDGPTCKERHGGEQCYKNLQPYQMSLN